MCLAPKLCWRSLLVYAAVILFMVTNASGVVVVGERGGLADAASTETGAG